MNKTKDYLLKLTMYFFIFSFAGWLLETAYCLSELGYFVKRGFLYGPICPIYGFGALILIIFLSKYKKQSLKLFLSAAIICSCFEYLVGFGLDALFAAKWWDYSSEFLNLNGRISLLFSFSWGIIAIIFINHVFPFIEKHFDNLFKKFNCNIQNIISISFICIFIADATFSCIKYLS